MYLILSLHLLIILVRLFKCYLLCAALLLIFCSTRKTCHPFERWIEEHIKRSSIWKHLFSNEAYFISHQPDLLIVTDRTNSDLTWKQKKRCILITGNHNLTLNRTFSTYIILLAIFHGSFCFCHFFFNPSVTYCFYSIFQSWLSTFL